MEYICYHIKCSSTIYRSINEEKNKSISKFSATTKGIITTEDSKIPCYVIPTDEELMIAKDTYELLK